MENKNIENTENIRKGLKGLELNLEIGVVTSIKILKGIMIK